MTKYDFVYAYLLAVSNYDEMRRMRYIPKQNIVYTKIAQRCNCSAQIVKVAFANLLADNLLLKNKAGQYFLPIAAPKYDNSVLLTIAETGQLYAYQIYDYLAGLNKYPCRISYKKIREELGINTAASANAYNTLIQYGLIEARKRINYHGKMVNSLEVLCVKKKLLL